MQNRFSFLFTVILSLTFSVVSNAWITAPKLVEFVQKKAIDSPHQKLALMITMYAYHQVGWQVARDDDSDLGSYFAWQAIQSDIGTVINEVNWDAVWTHEGNAAMRASRDRSWKRAMNAACDAVWQVADSRAYDDDWGQPRRAYFRGVRDLQTGTKRFNEAADAVFNYLSNNSALTLEVAYTEALETLPAELDYNPFESTEAFSHFRKMHMFPTSVFLAPWLTVLDLLGSGGPLPDMVLEEPQVDGERCQRIFEEECEYTKHKARL